MKLEESSGSANAEFAMAQNSTVQDVFKCRMEIQIFFHGAFVATG